MIHGDAVELVPEIGAEPVEDGVELTQSLVPHPGAVKVVAETVVELKGAVDALDDAAEGNLSGRFRQEIAAGRPLLGLDDARLGELAQDLQGEAKGDARALGQLGRRDRAVPGLDPAVYDADRLVGLVGDAQGVRPPFVYAFSIYSIFPFVKHFFSKKCGKSRRKRLDFSRFLR